MCGIAGIVTSQPIADLTERLEAMAKIMHHRGPDDGGVYLAPRGDVGFANRRLAIRDLSPAGHMPMTNQTEDMWITFNGEIYNADVLRSELEATGLRFVSESDTEVILKGYEAWGLGILDRLIGQFAFAIHDQRENRILLARDHLGIKPLYYAATNGQFVFASEVKAILRSGMVDNTISSNNMVAYLLFGSMPNPLTLYENIQALEPAHYLLITPDNPNPTPTRYWHIPQAIEATTNLEAAREQTFVMLKEGVRNRLVSDVPLGAFLSGGLDSSAVVALMRESGADHIKTCSVVFEEEEFSEGSYAVSVAEKMDTDHYERVITAADIINDFDHIIAHMDQPTIDGINTYFVSKIAREAGLTVALSGVGGDELFGGYPRTFQEVPRLQRAMQSVQRVPAGAWAASQVMSVMPKPRRWRHLQDALKRPPTLANAFTIRRGLYSRSEVKALVAPDIWQTAQQQFDLSQHVTRLAGTENGDTFAWISRAELQTYTHHQLLRDADVMSMAHSLEVRVPLLDKNLVEHVICLPAHLKTDSTGRPKPLLTTAVEHLLPELVLSRTDKQGFIFPMERWLRGGLSDRVDEILHNSPLNHFLQSSGIQAVHKDYQNQRIHWSRLWALVVLGSLLET